MRALRFGIQYLGVTMIVGAAAGLFGSAVASHLYPILNHVCEVMK